MGAPVGQPQMGQPNQFMQGQTGNGDPNNSNSTVPVAQPQNSPQENFQSMMGNPWIQSSNTPTSGKSGGKTASPSGGKGA
jgi:hypothetical protein